MTDDLSNDVRGWVQSETVDSIAEYAARGRVYAGLSTDDAKSQWVDAFRSLAADFIGSKWWQILSDLSSELSLRGHEPPYELVVTDIQKLSESMEAAVQSDVVGDESRGEETLARFLAFKSKKTN